MLVCRLHNSYYFGNSSTIESRVLTGSAFYFALTRNVINVLTQSSLKVETSRTVARPMERAVLCNIQKSVRKKKVGKEKNIIYINNINNSTPPLPSPRQGSKWSQLVGIFYKDPTNYIPMNREVKYFDLVSRFTSKQVELVVKMYSVCSGSFHCPITNKKRDLPPSLNSLLRRLSEIVSVAEGLLV